MFYEDVRCGELLYRYMLWRSGYKSLMKRSSISTGERITFLLLFAGYIAYYLTRKNITIASISMKELGLLTIAQIGYLSSLGTVCYAIGKFTNGFLADSIGGKRTFLIGMLGSVAASVLFSISSQYHLFLLFWGVNSYFLSMGWVGLIKVCSYWFGGPNRGTVLGWMSLNYQMGSSISKVFTAFLVGFPVLIWRGLFFVPAIVLLIMAVVVFIFLSEKPDTVPDTESSNAEHPPGAPAGSEGSSLRWIQLLKSPAFLLILWGSASITLIRTFFDDFTALWLNESGMQLDKAGYISALFTLGGMVGTVLVGYLSDRVGKGNRGPYMIASGCFLGILLFSSGFFPKDSVTLSMVFFFLTGIAVYGVYSVLAGVSAIDFGGNVAPSTAAGIIDGVGYLAAGGAGILVAGIKNIGEWESITLNFAVLTVVLSLSLLPLWRRYPTKSIA